MKKMIIIILVTIIGVVLFFYFVLRNKLQDVSRDEPYVYILNMNITTATEVIIIENTLLPDIKNEYPKEISDAEKIDTSRVQFIKLPVGSTVNFTKALHYTNSTSGMKYAVLIGKAKLKDSTSEYNVIYAWGFFKTQCIAEPCNYWEYKKELLGD